MECTRCQWRAIEDDPSARKPPWTDNDAQLRVSICEKCFAVSVQRYDDHSGFGSVWLLEPGASALLQSDPIPNHAARYALTKNYDDNETIADQLFTHFVQSLLNQNAIIQLLFRGLEGNYDAAHRALKRILTFLRAVRLEPNFHPLPLDALFRFVQGNMPEGPNGVRTNVLRLGAIDVLEALSDPAFGRIIDRRMFDQIQDLLDHANLTQRSEVEIRQAYSRIDIETIVLEADFLRAIFARRRAHLSHKLSDAIWTISVAIKHQCLTGAVGPEGAVAFSRLFSLLEHQLLTLGLLKTQTDKRVATFQNPRDGAAIRIPLQTPRIEWFDAGDSRPKIVADWAALLKRIDEN